MSKRKEKFATREALLKAGWQTGRAFDLAVGAAMELNNRGIDRAAILATLNQVHQTPADYLEDPVLGALAKQCQREHAEASPDLTAPVAGAAWIARESVRDEPLPYQTWGAQNIAPEAIAQMNNAMRLPVSVAGALMPDAHVGYGLPIGGVLACEGAVIPYAVGVDIACRMRLSVFDISPIAINQQKERFHKALENNTRFGPGAEWKGPQDDEILDDPDWDATRLLRGLKDKGVRQLGTSGSGNHFVDLGELELAEDDLELGLKAGTYLALLSHSGSRGVGFQIANTYSQIARSLHPELDKATAYLGWLEMSSEAGQEYWLSMNLAGRYAAANHRVIHKRIAKALGLTAAAVVENHHNYAWIEKGPDGRDVFVHRKGATPAGKGVLGVIPGSMGDPGYLVRGRGNPASLNSAAHGAGRQMSRTKALESITRTMRDQYLRDKGVTLLGGGLDESPQAYKSINDVIAAQTDLVDIVARFRPRVVLMSDDPRDI
jgi:tRNA-splicing ligase RtcB (3'-phosphate/5'-hydroxy nucleic acid ligase)